MRNLIFVSWNQWKREEVMSLLSDTFNVVCFDIDLPEIQSLSSMDVISAKLDAVNESNFWFQMEEDDIIMVEDTSLSFWAFWFSFPGPLIKFFTKAVAIENMNDFLSKHDNVEANAVTMIWVKALNTGEKAFFEGSISGRIVEPRGNEWFGWDPIFEISEWEYQGKTFSELSSIEKNEISMRKTAIIKFKEHYERYRSI